MPRIRVLVVDDAAIARSVVSRAVEMDGGLEVVGLASNGKEALAAISRLEPDIVTLDLVMPVMDGLEALPEIRRRHPRLPVIVLSTLTERGAEATLEALGRGATDYVTKPVGESIEDSISALRESLVPKIKTICAHDLTAGARAGQGRMPAADALSAFSGLDVVAIAASTGGPVALEELLSSISADISVPILIVQHMPEVFTGPWAARLSARTKRRVREVGAAQTIEAGDVWVARGGVHMRVRPSDGHVLIEAHDEAPRNSCRPSADVLFESVAAVYGARAVAVVLTGMGHDGLRGCESIVEAGGVVLAQDRMSSVVWGMPGAVVEAGLAAFVLSPQKIADQLQTWVRAARGRSAPRQER